MQRRHCLVLFLLGCFKNTQHFLMNLILSDQLWFCQIFKEQHAAKQAKVHFPNLMN